jgi:mono/diheme cytochrome c family protein
VKRAAILLVVVALGLGCIAAAMVLHDGLSATATPTKFEAFLAHRARSLATPANARAMVNPLQPSADNLRDARRHFADHCTICHANDGSGDTMLGRGMYPKPPDMRLVDTQNLSDGELFWIIEHGVRFTGMPAFPSHNDTDDNWKLVLFVRHLAALSPEERIDMEQYNPKGPADREEEKDDDKFLNGAQPETKKPTEHKH